MGRDTGGEAESIGCCENGGRNLRGERRGGGQRTTSITSWYRKREEERKKNRHGNRE